MPPNGAMEDSARATCQGAADALYPKHGYQTAVRELIEAKVQKPPKSAKPVAPPPRGSENDILAVLQESIRESAGKRKKTPGRPAATRRVTPTIKTKRRTGLLGNN